MRPGGKGVVMDDPYEWAIECEAFARAPRVPRAVACASKVRSAVAWTPHTHLADACVLWLCQNKYDPIMISFEEDH